MEQSRVRRIVLAALTLGLTVACGDGDLPGGDQGLIPDPPPNDAASGGPVERIEGVMRRICDAAYDCVGAEFFEEFAGVEDCVDQTMGEMDIDVSLLEVADDACLDAGLRYLECTDVAEDGLPDGSIRTWSDILFPYDPSTPLAGPLPDSRIVPTDRFAGAPVCEVYRCDSDGVITVELRRPAADDARTHEIYQD